MMKMENQITDLPRFKFNFNNSEMSVSFKEECESKVDGVLFNILSGIYKSRIQNSSFEEKDTKSENYL